MPVINRKWDPIPKKKLFTIKYSLIVMAVTIVMDGKSLNFNNSNGCNNSYAWQKPEFQLVTAVPIVMRKN